jgi:hypothetical protein
MQMSTSWTDDPATTSTPIKAVHINELRAAVEGAGGTPPGGWTDGPRVSTTTPIKAKHFVELRDAIQGLWNRCNLGTIPIWTSGVTPGGPSVGTTATPIYASDINDLRYWFNKWADLRGVHFYQQAGLYPGKTGWTVEMLRGVSDCGGNFDINGGITGVQNAVSDGLVPIVRLDYKAGQAVPNNGAEYEGWFNDVKSAMQAFLSAAGRVLNFIVGNEPNVPAEGSITKEAYCAAFNYLWNRRSELPSGAFVLVPGPAAFSYVAGISDLQWLEFVAGNVSGCDGFAIHTYSSPKVGNYDPRQPAGQQPIIGGDQGFQRFRDYCAKIRTSPFASKPSFVTETNTFGFTSTSPDDEPIYTYPVPGGGQPWDAVPQWMQHAFEAIRNYNQEGQDPFIYALCWYVDRNEGGNKGNFSLANTDPGSARLQQAKSDFIASNSSNR